MFVVKNDVPNWLVVRKIPPITIILKKTTTYKHLKGTLKVVGFATTGTLNICPLFIFYCTMKQ